MGFRPSRRALLGAASLLAVVSLGGVAVTTADASSTGRHALSGGPMVQVSRSSIAPQTNAPVVSTYGDPASVDPQLLGDQSSFHFALHWEVSGSVATEFLDKLSNIFSDVPGFIPETNSAAFAANAKDKVYKFDVTGAYVSPGRIKQSYTFGDNTYTEWLVNRKITTQYNQEKTNSKPLGANEEPLDGLIPVLLWDQGVVPWYNDYSSDGVLDCTPSSDQVNDMAVRDCAFNVTDDNQINEFMAIFNAGAITDLSDGTADAWLASDKSAPRDTLVRLAVSFTGKDEKNKQAKAVFTMDITDLNQKSVTVTAGK